MKKEKIAYTVHPVSAELKEKLNGDGYKILDARFAGDGDKIFNQPTPKVTEEAKDTKTK